MIHIVHFISSEVKVSVDVDSRFDAEFPVEPPLVSPWRVFVHAELDNLKNVLSTQNGGVNPGIIFRRAVMQQIDIRVFRNERALTIPTQKGAAVQPGPDAERPEEILELIWIEEIWREGGMDIGSNLSYLSRSF